MALVGSLAASTPPAAAQTEDADWATVSARLTRIQQQSTGAALSCDEAAKDMRAGLALALTLLPPIRTTVAPIALGAFLSGVTRTVNASACEGDKVTLEEISKLIDRKIEANEIDQVQGQLRTITKDLDLLKQDLDVIAADQTSQAFLDGMPATFTALFEKLEAAEQQLSSATDGNNASRLVAPPMDPAAPSCSTSERKRAARVVGTPAEAIKSSKATCWKRTTASTRAR